MSTITRKFSHTQREYFTAIRSLLTDGNLPDGFDADDLVEFVDSRFEQLDKKNSNAVRKPTAQQIQNEAFRADIAEWMEPETAYTVAEIHKGVPSIVASGISVSRVTACVTRLYNDGIITRETIKGKNYYTLA